MGAQSKQPSIWSLLAGAGGIYASFILLGLYQEGIYKYAADDGSTFQFTTFLLVVECALNVAVGAAGAFAAGPTAGLPQSMFALTGFTQIAAKFFTNAAMATGVSFPTQALAKSGKMVPVMIGGLLLGGRRFKLREYLQVAAIVGGTAVFNLAKRKAEGKASSLMGLASLVASLMCDGVTGGAQDLLKRKATLAGITAKPYDLMLWTNLYMGLYALLASAVTGELLSGYAWCMANPAVMTSILAYSVCSAMGQTAIFYTISVFDPLVCTTVTTTRKLVSVLSSIAVYGHSMSLQRWVGVALAAAGVLGELESKFRKKPHAKPV